MDDSAAILKTPAYRFLKQATDGIQVIMAGDNRAVGAIASYARTDENLITLFAGYVRDVEGVFDKMRAVPDISGIGAPPVRGEDFVDDLLSLVFAMAGSFRNESPLSADDSAVYATFVAHVRSIAEEMRGPGSDPEYEPGSASLEDELGRQVAELEAYVRDMMQNFRDATEEFTGPEPTRVMYREGMSVMIDVTTHPTPEAVWTKLVPPTLVRLAALTESLSYANESDTGKVLRLIETFFPIYYYGRSFQTHARSDVADEETAKSDRVFASIVLGWGLDRMDAAGAWSEKDEDRERSRQLWEARLYSVFCRLI